MSLPLVIMPEAHEGLLRNAQWWAKHHSVEQSERWYDGFVDALFQIPDHKHQHPLARENDAFPFELRALHYGVSSRPTHRALYTIRPDSIVVLTVLGAAEQDFSPDDL